MVWYSECNSDESGGIRDVSRGSGKGHAETLRLSLVESIFDDSYLVIVTDLQTDRQTNSFLLARGRKEKHGPGPIMVSDNLSLWYTCTFW